MMTAERTPPSRGFPQPAPWDFDERFARCGRVECQDYYGAKRELIDAWLRERGKKRLLELRAQHVTRSGEESMGAVVRYGRETVDRWRAEGSKRLTVGDAKKLLDLAYPVEDGTMVAPDVAQAAAAHLRIARNGGWPVSASPNGFWWIGTRLCSAEELVDFATRKGFEAPNLTNGER